MNETLTKKRSNPITIKRLVFDASFCALATILYIFLKIEGNLIPIFPNFLDINFSMIPIIICAFMLGPWDAGIAVIVRCLLKWLFVGSKTGYVGEVADILIGLAACIPAGLIYHKSKFKYKGLIALISVVVGWVLMGVLSNLFVNIPWYNSYYFHTNYYKDGISPAFVGLIKDAVKAISFGKVTDVTTGNFMLIYIIFSVIPFNIILSLIIVLITVPVHHRLRPLYDMIGFKKKNKDFSNFEEKESSDEIKEDTNNSSNIEDSNKEE